MINIIRKRILLEGRVQGVGLRYRAYYSASTFGVTGYVTNLEDGSVEMEVQGTSQDIDVFLDNTLKGNFIYVTNIDAKTIPIIEEREFKII